MASIFTNASTARTNTRNNSVIHGEVRAIEAAVLANIDAGVLYANATGTTMTNSNAYYNAYRPLSRSNKIRPGKLCKVFTDKGYGVKIKQNPVQQILLPGIRGNYQPKYFYEHS